MTDSEHTVIIVMGVCGVGKTSVGRALAERLGARYIEADDFHSRENVDAMAKGIPLTDEMRLPWLEKLAHAAEKARNHETVVMACSALKQSYRILLRDHIGKVQFVFLHGDRNLLAARLGERADHFMPASLLDSQIATLEPPSEDEHAISVNVARAKAEVDDAVEQSVRATFASTSI